MFLHAFTAELLEHRDGLRKTAGLFAPRPDRLVERLAATGALSSGALQGLRQAKAGLTSDPYDSPGGSVLGEAAKGAAAGGAVALLLKALGRMHNR